MSVRGPEPPGVRWEKRVVWSDWAASGGRPREDDEVEQRALEDGHADVPEDAVEVVGEAVGAEVVLDVGPVDEPHEPRGVVPLEEDEVVLRRAFRDERRVVADRHATV